MSRWKKPAPASPQLDLLGRRVDRVFPARTTDPSTSHIAAKSIEPHMSRLERIALGAIRTSANGLTIHELSAVTNMPFITIGPRTAPLRRKGLIYDSGERRLGDSGRPSIVWKATEEGSECNQPRDNPPTERQLSDA